MSSIASKAPSSEGGKASPKAESNGEATLDSVNAKLANFDLGHNDRMGQLEADPFAEDDSEDDDDFDLSEYTEEEIGCRNKGVRILPGVRRIIDGLPTGRWAVATSGAKTYCHGALARAGIKRPKVTVTADDPRLTAGKPDPAPFLLAAKDLGIPIEKCLVFEDCAFSLFFLPPSLADLLSLSQLLPVSRLVSLRAPRPSPSAPPTPSRRSTPTALTTLFPPSTASTFARTRTAPFASSSTLTLPTTLVTVPAVPSLPSLPTGRVSCAVSPNSSRSSSRGRRAELPPLVRSSRRASGRSSTLRRRRRRRRMGLRRLRLRLKDGLCLMHEKDGRASSLPPLPSRFILAPSLSFT
jgi:HAD superfamily hydrolase (TIGR01509 family)